MSTLQTTVARDQSFFDAVGGHATFRALLAAFFEEMREYPDLLALYPADDLAGAEARLMLFLEQYWGGPTTYSQTRGAPMLKMRHMPYKITAELAEAWATCMHRAAERIDLDPEHRAALDAYVARGARYLVNAD